jgi:ubiquitin-protein ligase
MLAELAELGSSAPIPGVRTLGPVQGDESMLEWQAVLEMPQGGGRGGVEVRVGISLTSQYPFAPPALRFVAPPALAAAWGNQDLARLLPSTAQWSPANSVRAAVSELLVLLPDLGRGHLSPPSWAESRQQQAPAPEPEPASKGVVGGVGPEAGPPPRASDPADPEGEWAVVEKEVSAWAATPAGKAGRVGGLQRRSAEGGGGAELELQVAGPPGTGYARGLYRIRLGWGPAAARGGGGGGVATLVFLSQISHAYLFGGAAGRAPLPAFFELLRAGSRGRNAGSKAKPAAVAGWVGLAAVLKLLERILSGAQPLGADLAAATAGGLTGAPGSVGPEYARFALAEAGRQAAIEGYRPQCKAPALFRPYPPETAQTAVGAAAGRAGWVGWRQEWTAEPLRVALAGGGGAAALKAVAVQEASGLFSVDLLTAEACVGLGCIVTLHYSSCTL